MILMKDISITEKLRSILGSKNIRLSEITYKKLFPVMKKEFGYDIEFYTNKNWNKFKQTSHYQILMDDINELFELGYGCKFISLCLTVKYKIFISFHMIQKRLNKNRLENVINNNIFVNSDIAIKGRIIYNKSVGSFYLLYKCAKIRDLSKIKRIGIKVFFDTENKKVYLERDDRSAKKITVHSNNDLYISLYPLPDKFKVLKITDTTYNSSPIEVNFNSNNFGYKRYELIDDTNSRLLFLCLEKFGFELEKKRTTNVSRSEGDLIVYKNGTKVVIEITNVNSSPKNYSINHKIRDYLIGKITRICLTNNSPNGKMIFVLNNNLKNSVINEDFDKVINHFNPNVFFTNFHARWEKTIAEEINKSFESK